MPVNLYDFNDSISKNIKRINSNIKIQAHNSIIRIYNSSLALSRVTAYIQYKNCELISKCYQIFSPSVFANLLN